MTRYASIAYANDEAMQADANALGLWTPARQGIAAWTSDPLTTSTSTTTPLQTVCLMPLWCAADAVVNTIYMILVTVGVTLSNCYAGLYDQQGNLLGTTADISAALVGATGLITLSLTAPVTLKVGGLYYVAILQNGTTAAALRCGYASSAAAINIGRGRYFKATTAAPTALLSPLGAVVISSNTIWAAVT